jgi:hypothetical protein
MNFWGSGAGAGAGAGGGGTNNTSWPTPGGEFDQRKQLLSDVKTAIQLVLNNNDDNGDPTVYDHNMQLNALGFALEQALRYGLRDHSSFFRKKDYWNYLKKIAKLNPQVAQPSVSTVENLPNIKVKTTNK